jgi:hypothetical protein
VAKNDPMTIRGSRATRWSPAKAPPADLIDAIAGGPVTELGVDGAMVSAIT